MAKENNKSEFRFLWKIENYSFCYQLNNYCLQSPSFIVDGLNRSQWCLSFHPKGKITEYKDYVSCTLHRIKNDDNVCTVVVDFKIEIIAGNGITLKSIEIVHEFTRIENHYNWDNIITNDEIIKELKNSVGDMLTISCCIKCEESSSDQITGCQARTQIGVNRLYFHWDVKNFPFASSLVLSKSCYFTEETFFIELCSHHDDFLIFIHLVNKKSARDYFATGRIALLDVDKIKNKIEIYSKNDSHLFKGLNITGENTWKFPCFIKKYQLRNTNTCRKNNTFTLVFDLSISNGKAADRMEKYIYDIPGSSPSIANVGRFSTLHKDLRSMLENNKHCDMKLQTRRRSFTAHKALLAARSPVFSAMFEQNMKESQTGVIEILDIDENIFEYFLNYLYTDSVECLGYDKTASPGNTNNYHCYVNLLVLADRYQVLSLKEKCSFFLMSNLSADNVCEVLGLSDMIGDKVLKTSAIDYIKVHSEEILSKEEWYKWIENNCKLGSEVLCKLSTHIQKCSRNISLKQF